MRCFSVINRLMIGLPALPLTTAARTGPEVSLYQRSQRSPRSAAAGVDGIQRGGAPVENTMGQEIARRTCTAIEAVIRYAALLFREEHDDADDHHDTCT